MTGCRALLAITVTVLIGCKQAEEKKTPVARLDNRTLTLEEVRAEFDSSRTISQAQLQEYVRRWINNEMLYREAVRLGLDQRRDVMARAEEIQRQLVINALLTEKVYTDQTSDFTREDLASYYDRHKQEFLLPTSVALVSFVLFDDRDVANSFRSRVLRGTSWSDALMEVYRDSVERRHIRSRVDSSYFTQASLFPQELWRVASALAKPEPSFPIRTDNGFYILIVWKSLREGQPADLAYVQDEIRGRMTIARRKQKLDSLLENLRSQHTVEIMVNAGVLDTVKMGQP